MNRKSPLPIQTPIRRRHRPDPGGQFAAAGLSADLDRLVVEHHLAARPGFAVCWLAACAGTGAAGSLRLAVEFFVDAQELVGRQPSPEAGDVLADGVQEAGGFAPQDERALAFEVDHADGPHPARDVGAGRIDRLADRFTFGAHFWGHQMFSGLVDHDMNHTH